MIYVISDLHGYPLPRFKKLLALAGFSSSDHLFILGDVIDRNGDGGAAMLYWLTFQTNIELILGNHEAMLLSCSFLFDEITEVYKDFVKQMIRFASRKPFFRWKAILSPFSSSQSLANSRQPRRAAQSSQRRRSSRAVPLRRPPGIRSPCSMRPL